MPLKVKPVHVTVLALPLFLSAKVHVPLAVTSSVPTFVARLMVQSALLVPSYILLLHVALGVKVFGLMVIFIVASLVMPLPLSVALTTIL